MGSNRLIRVEDDGKFDIRYEYDEVGNPRRVKSDYTDLLTNRQLSQDFWYEYDAANRFTTTMGQLLNGEIVRSATGYDITYNAAGERATQTTTDVNGNAIRERYVYDNNGFLTDVHIKPNASADEALRARRTNNAIGERLEYREYNAGGQVTSAHAYSYDADHLLLQDHDIINDRGTTFTLLADGRTHQTATYDNVTANAAVVQTTYAYEAWDSYQQKTITVVGIAPAHTIAGVWQNGTSTFSYDVNGHVEEVYDHHEQRRLHYASNHHGQTLKRYEYDADDNQADVVRSFYYFNGKPIGDQGTDDVPSRVDYAQSLRTSELEGPGNKRYIEQQRLAMLPAIWRQYGLSYGAWGPYGNYAGVMGIDLGPVGDKQHQDIGRRVIPVTSVDFDQNFRPINADYPGAAPTTYVVEQGDTLQAIAAKVWGDASLWYLLADANGLFGSEELVTHQRLTIPNKVTNFHNTAQTSRAFEPGLTMGNTEPTLPDPPAYS